jgi:hypothetical protein
MKRVVIAAFAMLTIAAGAVAAEKPAAANKSATSNRPNFSGEWTMNAAKSNFGQLPAPAKFVRKIQHSVPSLTVIEEQTAGGNDSTTTRKITTDGKSVTIELNGAPALCSSVWDGSDLVATTALDTVGLKFTDRMSLSSDGKLLTSKVQIASPQGDAELTIVFDRQ